MSDLKDLDRDELEMLSQYIQNQQQIIFIWVKFL